MICSARHDEVWLRSVRSLLAKRGVPFEEPRLSGETTPVAMADKYVAMLKQTPDVSDLQTKITEAEESGRKATVVDASYTEPLNGQPAKLTVRSFFFEDNGQIWHVMYMYKDGDELAKEVVDHVFGQLK